MLNTINSPEDLKKLKFRQLAPLAEEIRNEIVQTVSRQGGHLSSNLGAVELTLALDYVFDYTKDRLIFDVGHQSYAHKLLTGRQAAFRSLRAKNGLCGFTSMAEDPNDCFTSGHASTSISAALGYCRARDLRGGSEHVVAVIGDGAMTGGMSYEAMNDAGQSSTNLIVILNDNQMSISRNVGALSAHLTSIRHTHFYRNIKTGTRSVLQRIPLIGKPLFRGIEKLRDMLKALVIGENLFDAMGFKYVGPIDGHDLRKLVKVLNRAKKAEGPVLIHAVTCKGKGYAPAEAEPAHFHGPAPFRVETGDALRPGEMSYGEHAGKMLIRMADRDRRVCAVTAAMPQGTGMSHFAERYPDRLFDVGIAEEHAVTMAGGLAAAGMKPYVAVYSTFLQRAYDQIVNDVCLNSLPVTFLIDRAGLVGPDGATHNGLLDLSFLRTIPNLTVAAPRDLDALYRLMEWSRTFEKPLAIRYPKATEDLGDGMSRRDPIERGRWETLLEGEDITILAVGRMVQTALMTSVQLHADGISAGVVDAMFVKPMDEKLLRELPGRTKLIVTMEENDFCGGFGEGVLSALNRMEKSCPTLILGAPDRFVKHASVKEQLSECRLTPEQASRAILLRWNKLTSKN